MAAATEAAVGSACGVRVRVCALDELPWGIGRVFIMAGQPVAIFRTREGKLHAVENACPHRGGPLADGIVTGNHIVCPLHARRFELDSGQCDDSSVCTLKRFAVQVQDGQVFLILPDLT